MKYFTKLSSTGAIRETPQKVVDVLLQESGNKHIDSIVEIGAGKGELTKVLLKKYTPSNYFAFEIDEAACNSLKIKFPQITVRKEDAFDFIEHISQKEKIGLFISSIPLSFYPRSKIRQLLFQAKDGLATDGKMIIVFTAFWLIPILKRHLPGAKLFSFLTFPPYFIIVYNKEIKN